MNFEHIYMRNLGKTFAKELYRYTKKEKKVLGKNKEVLIEIDESCIMEIISERIKFTIKTMKRLKEDNQDEEDKECFEIFYNSFVERLCRRCRVSGTVERDGKKIMYWKF